MHRWIRNVCLCLVISVCPMAIVFADEPAAEKKSEKPATHTVAKSPLKMTAELDGIFEGESAAEVALSPSEWPSMTVKSVVPHGARVSKGDVLIQLETEKLDRAIADLAAELRISEVAVRQSEEQLKALEKTVPWDLEAGQRGAQMVEEDHKHYFDINRPFSVRSAEFHLKAAKDSLDYAQEELDQLEKMYKADDITEESEEIVLKRGRNALESAKFSMSIAQLTYDHTVKFAIPRKDEEVKESTRRGLLAWEKSKVELPLALQKQRLEVEKIRTQHAQSVDRLKRMQADREAMTVKSPADGIVFYGKFTNGRPADSAAMGEVLRVNGTIQPNQIVMTVVSPRPLLIRANMPENLLDDLQTGMAGVATPTGYSEMKLPAVIDRVSDIPISQGNFEARLKVELKGKTRGLAPGMTCKVKFVTYQKAAAICIPQGTIITDEQDEQKKSVKVVDKDGKPTVRAVTVGKTKDNNVEILDGLTEGEQILSDPSKEQK